MKRSTIILAGCVFFHLAQSQNITGDWKGNLSVQGNEIPIVFHIKKDSADKLAATFDSPKQYAFNLPCSDITVSDSVVLWMKVLNGKYAGKLSADNKTLTGVWYQGAVSLPLTVFKTNDTATTASLKRPQTPKPPFNYAVEEVAFDNADRSVHFGGTFTVPVPDSNIRYIKAPTYRTVILISGSGQQDRDETIFGHKPFAVLADHLTRQGIAVLRIDDRGIGKTTGNFSRATTGDFAEDLAAAINFLKKRRDVDTGYIGLIGHSEGGMIAPMVASRRKDISYIVLLAGPGIPIINLMSDQVKAVYTSYNNSPATVKAGGELFRLFAKQVINSKDTAINKKVFTNIMEKWASATDKAVLEEMKLADTASRLKSINEQIAQLGSPWYNYFIRFKPADYLRKVACPVLALNGEKDIQVSAKPNLMAIKNAIVKSKATVKELPGLNHLFQHCQKCTVEEYGELKETFSPEVLGIISSWIKNIKK